MYNSANHAILGEIFCKLSMFPQSESFYPILDITFNFVFFFTRNKKLWLSRGWREGGVFLFFLDSTKGIRNYMTKLKRSFLKAGEPGYQPLYVGSSWRKNERKKQKLLSKKNWYKGKIPDEIEND
jgi:hypothetical protein